MDDTAFETFFLRWEQLLAYVRKSVNDELSNTILGIDRVNKHWQGDKMPISIERVVLLENQRYTGIWGRYNSPFKKMVVVESDVFSAIFSEKTKTIHGLTAFKNCLMKPSFEITKHELEAFIGLFSLSEKERTFWRSQLLTESCEGEWHRMVEENRQQLHEESFYSKLAIIGGNASESLKSKLTEITNTERLLCPLSRIFRYLQTRSFWTKDEIESDTFINKCREASANVLPDYFTRQPDKKRRLYSILNASSNWETVSGIAAVNYEVSNRRGGSSWITHSSDTLDINHREGANGYIDFDPANDSDNDYFTGTYLRLFDTLNAQNDVL